MENLRLLAVVDRVVAWHNRHPLARRISAAQVHAIGYVALPFTAEAPPAAAPRPAEAAAQAIAAAAAAAAEPLPVLTELAPAAAGGAAGATSPGEGSRLRERALARARELGPAAQAADSAAAFLATLAPAALKPAFSEDFIDPLSPRQVARFAQKHGRVLARAPLDGPVREVLIDTALVARQNPAAPARWPVSVYLLTAVIETDTRKSRVLLGLGPAVLGRRILSRPRVAALAALSAGLLGAPLWLLRPAAPAATGAAAALVPAPGLASAPAAASAAWAAAAPASAFAAAGAAAPGAGPSSGPASSLALTTAPAESPAQPAATPLPEAALADGSSAAPAPLPEPPAADQPRRRAVNIVPMLSEAAKEQARAERRALMEAAAPTAAPVPPPMAATQPETVPPPPPPPAPANPRAPAPPPSPAPAPVAAPRAPAAVPLSGPVFAISTRPLRTRAEAEQVQAAMQSLLGGAAPAGLRVEVLPEGDDWRVVAMPYARSADAERGRALLASRGMRVKVVDF